MSPKSLEIIAAADNSGAAKAKVKGVAYSGAKMRLGGWYYPVVVDVNAMEIPAEVPILANHENHTSARIGLAKVTKVDNHLEIDGEIVAKGEIADPIIEQAKAGAKWQVSIGAEVHDAVFVKAGKVSVNGMDHEGPVNHVTKSTLREISVVAVGADKNTSLSIAAAFSAVGASIPDPAPEQPAPEIAAASAPADSPTNPAPTPTAASCDWEARFKGASKKINELQATIAANAADYKSLQCQLDEAKSALAAAETSLNEAKAENEQLKAQVEDGAKSLEAKDKDLAQARDNLSKAQGEIEHLKQSRELLTAGVLSPKPDDFDARIKAAHSPEEREAIRAEKFNKA